MRTIVTVLILLYISVAMKCSVHKGKSLYANYVIGVKINVPIMLYHRGGGKTLIVLSWKVASCPGGSAGLPDRDTYATDTAHHSLDQLPPQATELRLCLL